MGQAGASAQAEYERRRARERKLLMGRAKITVPLLLVLCGLAWWAGNHLAEGLGWFFAAVAAVKLGHELWRPAQQTRAWARGAEGERATADVLGKLEADGLRVLHDRQIPGSRANIDHIVIGAPGVFVVETKQYSGKVTARGGSLYYKGRCIDRYLDQARREAHAVRTTLDSLLAPAGVDVEPIVCIHGAEQTPRRAVGGIAVVGPRGLRRLLRKRPARLDGATVARLAERAEHQFAPATATAPERLTRNRTGRRDTAPNVDTRPGNLGDGVVEPAEVVLRPWRRYGHDRLYANANGQTLGFVDRITDEIHADNAAARQAIADAYRAYTDRQS